MIKQTIRNHLQTTHGDTNLRSWFDPLTLRFVDDQRLEVIFPHSLFADWFSDDKRLILQREIANILKKDAIITFTVADASPKTASKVSPRLGLTYNRFASVNDTTRHSFTTFMFNRKNDFPVQTAKEVAQNVTTPPFNPFVIKGKGTCGKTHLLHAMAIAMNKNGKKGNIYLGSISDIVAEYGKEAKQASVRKELLSYRAIFIDDVQEVIVNHGLQRELIYIVDQMREMNKPLVFAIDDEKYNEIDPKLRSRLESGLVVSLKKPDIDVRMRYAKQLAEKLSVNVKREHLLQIVQNVHDLRHLEGTLTKVAAFKSSTGGVVTEQDIEKILHHTDMESDKPLTPDAIITSVAEQLSCPVEEILGLSRQRETVFARQLSMYLCRELLGLSFPVVGTIFNGKNHATVLHSYKKIHKLQSIDKDINKLLTIIRKKCSKVRR